jgi:hypothetical protein
MPKTTTHLECQSPQQKWKLLVLMAVMSRREQCQQEKVVHSPTTSLFLKVSKIHFWSNCFLIVELEIDIVKIRQKFFAILT